jgi:hypothetical protein
LWTSAVGKFNENKGAWNYYDSGKNFLRCLSVACLKMEKPMAVFIAFSDECHSKKSGNFYYSGLVAPESDWLNYFSPAWQERVLDGPPKIPHLHTTDIRNSLGREKYGLTALEADRCIDEAISIISTTGSIFPITIGVNALLFNASTNHFQVRDVDSPQFQSSI